MREYDVHSLYKLFLCYKARYEVRGDKVWAIDVPNQYSIVHHFQEVLFPYVIERR